jgi:hypothetical protein
MRKVNIDTNPEEDDKSGSKKNKPELQDFAYGKWTGSSPGTPLWPIDIQDLTSGSVVQLGGTISALSTNVHEIKNTLSSTDSLVTSKDFKALLNNFQEVSKSVANIEGLIPNLESIKDTLDKVNKFNETNTAVLTDLVSSKGRLDGIQGEMNSIKYRLDELEKTKDRNTTRILSFLAIIVAVIAAISAWFK